MHRYAKPAAERLESGETVLGHVAQASGFGRPVYYPQWGDDKHRLAYISASRMWFGEDLSDEILNEVRHRQQRAGSRDRPGQPWPQADIKVWRRFARQRGNRELLNHLAGVARAERPRW